MAGYYLAPSLVVLRAEVNAAWPGRDKTSDGWIGDTSHAARRSDHNPDPPGVGVVRALDLDVNGIDVEAVKAAAFRHPATNYVLHNRQSFTRANGFRPIPYRGPNPHTGHIHISIQHDRAAETTQRPWLGATRVSSGTDLPTLNPITPGGTLPGPLTPEDDMPYTRDELEAIVASAVTKVSRAEGLTGAGDIRRLAEGLDDTIRQAVVQGTTSVLRSEGVSGAGDLGRLVAALAPLLGGQPGAQVITELSQQSLDAIAAAVADEQARRLQS